MNVSHPSLTVTWRVDQANGDPASLSEELNDLTRRGWSVTIVLTNGINAWTIMSTQPATTKRKTVKRKR